MAFLPHLKSVVEQVDGAVACSVMGFDGIPVETHEAGAVDDVELNNTWVEYGNVLAQLKTAAELLKTGSVQEVSVNAEKLLTLMRLVNEDYFLVLAMKPTANYGKGRYALRLAAPKVKAEL
jgi:predicted regulator of Ras-like GTPase activity (Roadblock/LC7/MglB family)